MKRIITVFSFLLLIFICVDAQQPRKIVNLVNFIRLLEPRDSAITQEVLFHTVEKQVAMMRKYQLEGSFLLQYDALMDPRYQQLLKSLPRDSFEVGAWWEIPQPLVEKAGMKWRGRYPWDWHANIGFSTGYTQPERKKLIDIYMADFKKIFGYYPASVASWFIDAYSLKYMQEKYGIVASANCKDQYGTDGYTLWGGYWNQAYYPSKVNSYMPAQHASEQINVPVFRLLGSDPVRQYDTGLGSERQGVITLEPVYEFGGGDSAWVHWFLNSFVSDPSVGFNYAQAGQENSFTWDAMKKGFEIQLPLLAKLRDEKKIDVETLAASGRWFLKKYKVTPPTSFSVSEDIAGSDRQTVWFNSRFYRVNLIWEKGTLRIRDLHLFDEQVKSAYLSTPATENECRFFTLPVIDGYLWSKDDTLAGARLTVTTNGKPVPLQGGKASFQSVGDSALQVSWPLTQANAVLHILITEKEIRFQMEGQAPANWHFDLTTASGIDLPFTKIASEAIRCQFEKTDYSLKIKKGICSTSPGTVWRISPEGNIVQLNCSASK